MVKLKVEDKEHLAEMASSDAFKPLISVIEGLCAEQQDEILRLPVPQTPDRELLIAKAKAMGALKLKADLVLFLTKLKHK